MKWFGTARGRIGWVPVDGAMIYATGGGAWIGIDETDTIVSRRRWASRLQAHQQVLATPQAAMR
jgi:opacity protein-like surface antigen